MIAIASKNVYKCWLTFKTSLVLRFMMKLVGHRRVVVANVATHWHCNLLTSFVIVCMMTVASYKVNIADQKVADKNKEGSCYP